MHTAAAALALALASPMPVFAQAADAPTEYRIEVLIVEPQNPVSDAWPVTEPVRFEQYFDPRMAAQLVRNLEPVWAPIDALGPPVPRPPSPRIGLLPPDDEREPEPTPVERPWAFIALDALPPALADARERMERTGEFTAIAAMAWLQPTGSARQPRPMRVHDDVEILRELPGSEATDEGDNEPPTTPTGARRSAPLNARFGDLDAEAADAAERARDGAPGEADVRAGDSIRFGPEATDPLDHLRPLPRVTVRLDGTIALVRRQFLHADLDLHWRSPIQRPPALSGPGSTDAATGPTDSPQFEVHRLQQSRVVRTDRWEYFDSARFGVLLRVTELEPLLPLPPPEPVGPDSGPDAGSGAANPAP